ncbi:hypothetical protein JTB14_035198 [Gonioctena quinquepunctata]|nr:hypothetical protein JTB14_035198 [Gonioctena quinquepunctata]
MDCDFQDSEERKNICRLCLSKTVISHSLLEEDRANILESLTSIRVEEDDQFPQSACIKCWLNLKYAYHIQQNFLEADRKLRLLKFDQIEIDNDDDTVEVQVKVEQSPEIEVNENELEENKPDIGSLETVKFENQTDGQVLIIYKYDSVEQPKVDEKNSCKICGDIALESEMLDHIKTHYFSQIRCDECKQHCESIESYRNHCVEKHPDMPTGPWKCIICKTSFLYKPLYMIHFSRAHKKPVIPPVVMQKLRDIEKTYDCPYCNRKFRTESSSLAHAKTHQKKKCDVCGMHISPTNFRAHYKAHIEGPVVCHLCGDTYKNSVSLRSHIHYTHSTRTYLCEFCQKIFKKSYDLLLHIRRDHIGEKNHVCDECGKRFYTFYTLNKHKKMTHQKLRPFPCQYCKKKFSSRNARVTHERQHTNVTPYICDECGIGFRQNVSLKSHKKSVHNYVEELTHECEVCGKKFGSQFAVVSHMRLH